MHNKIIDNQVSHLYEFLQPNDSNDVTLWRAVIAQALVDVSIKSTKKKVYKYLKQQASSWLLGRSKEFHMVCNMADVNPEEVIKTARDVIFHGKKLDIIL